MAIRHGLAGQHGKSEANKRSKRILGILMVAGCYGLAGIGFAFGYFWSHGGPTVALVGMVILAGVGFAIWRPLSRHIEKTAKERIRYMRGGQGEALVAWLLEDLDDDWHVFNCLKLERDSDIDHVVVGPGGLFCISTKSHRGIFSGTPDGLRHNGQASPFAQQAMRQAMDLKDRLAVAMGKDVPWVQSVLAVPFGFTDNDAFGGKVWLVHQDDLGHRIAPESGPKRLTKQQVARTVRVLEMIKHGAAEVYQRPDAPAQPSR